MANGFLDVAETPSVKAAQAANGSGEIWNNPKRRRSSDRFTAEEAEFIAARDSLYMATVSENGWPYVQHRGGPAGFLRMIDDKTLAFADFRGNRQYISLGNIAANNRVALFLMDYPDRRRLKIYACIEAKDLKLDPELAARLTLPGYPAKPERAFLLHLQAFDWNCPQHITPRFTEQEIDSALAPVRSHIARLEAENKDLRERLEVSTGGPNAEG
jgi:predicted pyridoxine 5'-phosphate oxidase superfamily flavin-nucleotide-binding protein